MKLQPDPYILQCLFEEGETQEVQINRLRFRGIRSSIVELSVFLEFCAVSVGDLSPTVWEKVLVSSWKVEMSKTKFTTFQDETTKLTGILCNYHPLTWSCTGEERRPKPSILGHTSDCTI